MFTLGGFRRVKQLEKLYFCESAIVRFLSTEAAAPSHKIETVARRYSKPLSTTERKPLTGNFLRNLFAGTVDKEIFEYPEVLRESENNIVLDHSLEVENFLAGTSNDEISKETLEKLRELELFGLSVAQKYGGAGYNETECKFLQECTGSNLKIARFLGYNENFGCKLLSLFGSEEQKEKYLPPLAQGKILISLAYLENKPLIDLGAMESFAITDEINKQYIITGEKKWVHNADKADLFIVLTKSTEFLPSQSGINLQLKAFIVEKNTPGLMIHKLESKLAQENGLYYISLKDVAVPQSSGIDVDGTSVVKAALSHNNVTDAVLCSNLLKCMGHEILNFMQEKNLTNPLVQGQGILHENLATLFTYIYALESVIYLITGRYDKYEDPDILNETIFAKNLAIDCLQIGIQKYTEILGRDSFLSSGRLEEAIQALQYYSVFDENSEYLKIMNAAEGLIYAGRRLHNTVNVLRKPYEHTLQILRYRFSFKKLGADFKPVKSQNFKEEVHMSLKQAADQLDEFFNLFQATLLALFVNEGALALNNETAIVKMGDMATYIYALVACLSRAHSSVSYDFSDCEKELFLTEGFSYIAGAKIKELYTEGLFQKDLDTYYSTIGKEIFNRKGYPVEHPLSRTF